MDAGMVCPDAAGAGAGARSAGARLRRVCCAAACAVAVLACAGVLRGRGPAELAGAPPRALLNGFATEAPARRKAQLGMMLASAERFSRQLSGLARTQLPESSQLCAKKDFIIGKFDELLMRLGVDDQQLNVTDLATEKAYEDAMQAWLDTESVYRLAVQTHKESKEASMFALKKLAVEMKVHELTKEKVAEVVKQYPIKKEEIDGERELILELIKLVEELTGKSGEEGATAKGTSSTTLTAIQKKLAALAKVAGGPAGSTKLQKGLREVEAKMMKEYSAAQALKGKRFSKLQASPEEMQATKNEVKKVLLELLQDPDFRAFMLKMGMMHLMAALTQEEGLLKDDEQAVADLSEKQDQATHQEKDSDLQRGPAAGEKTTREEEYTDEHKAYLQTITSVQREIYIIKKIKRKIINFCETGTFAKTKPVRARPPPPPSQPFPVIAFTLLSREARLVRCPRRAYMYHISGYMVRIDGLVLHTVVVCSLPPFPWLTEQAFL